MTIPGLSPALASLPAFSPGLLAGAGLPEFASIIAGFFPEIAENAVATAPGASRPATVPLTRLLAQAVVEEDSQPEREGQDKKKEEPKELSDGQVAVPWPVLPAPEPAPGIPTAAAMSTDLESSLATSVPETASSEVDPGPSSEAPAPAAGAVPSPTECVAKETVEAVKGLLPALRDDPPGDNSAEQPQRRTVPQPPPLEIAPAPEIPAAVTPAENPVSEPAPAPDLPAKAVKSAEQNWRQTEVAFVARLVASAEKDPYPPGSGTAADRAARPIGERPSDPAPKVPVAGLVPRSLAGKTADTPPINRPPEPAPEPKKLWIEPARSGERADNSPGVTRPGASSGYMPESLIQADRKHDAAQDLARGGDIVPPILRTMNIVPDFSGAKQSQPAAPARLDGSAGAIEYRTYENAEEPVPAERPMPVREIALRVSEQGQANVDLRLRERGGELLLAVGTRDAGLGRALGRELPELADRLGSRGFRGEVWRPAGVEHQPAGGSGSDRWNQGPAPRHFFGGDASAWERQRGGEQQRREQQQRRGAEASGASFSLAGILAET